MLVYCLFTGNGFLFQSAPADEGGRCIDRRAARPVAGDVSIRARR